MTRKAIAASLILTAFALVGAASAEDGGFRGGGGLRGDGFHGRGFHGRGFHNRNSPVIVDGFVVDGYGFFDGGGYAGYGAYGNWYGISPGYDECPLFRKRVMTPEGWRDQMVPVC